MARKSKAERWKEVHRAALEEFDQIWTETYDERRQCNEDRRFVVVRGAQWEGLSKQFENRPMFELNKVAASCMRIENEYRNSRLSPQFISRNGKSDELCDVLDSLYRADEQDSGGFMAYDNALGEGIRGGMGAWRYVARPEDEYDDSDDYQRIRIEPIYDADTTVFFGLDGRKPDKSDATTCFVLTPYTHAAFKRQFPKAAAPSSWQKDDFGCMFDWVRPDRVWVAEYFVIDKVKETVNVYEDLLGEEVEYTDKELDDDDGAQRKELELTGARLKRQEKQGRKVVRKYMLSGNETLDECIVPGRNIPIVPYYGNRSIIDGIERIWGHIAYAKDSQRLMNMQISKLAEIMATSSEERPILTASQIAGNEGAWANANLNNLPYYLVNDMQDAQGNPMPSGPLGYTKTPQVPPVIAALFAAVDASMKDILGNPQAGDILVSGTSGKAAEIQQQRLDMASFIYMSNLATSMKRGAEIWRDMAREVYVEEKREMKAVGQDGKSISTTMVNVPQLVDGKMVISKDMMNADYDVTVDVGPSSVSARAATVRSVQGMLAVPAIDPTTANVLVLFSILNMEGEGIGDLRDWARQQLLRQGVVKPTEEEQAQLQAEASQQQEDPNATLLKAASEEAVAKAQKARAEVVETAANTEFLRAKTAEVKGKALGALGDLEARANGVAPVKPMG